MPPKTCTCNICGQTVTKAKTLQFKDGRACREHEGVHEWSDKQQESQKKGLISSIKKMEEKSRPRKPESFTRIDDMVKPMCWRCGVNGIALQDFYLQCAVAMEKMKLVGEDFNFFELPNQIKKFIPEEFKTPIIPVNLLKKPEVVEKLKYKFRVISMMGGFAYFCPKCLKDLKLEQDFKAQIEKNNPKLEIKDMYMIGALMQPELEKVAREQLKQEGVEIK